MTLLTTVQDAAVLLGLESPSAVASSSDQTVAQLKALAQQEGDELSRFFDWRKLKVDYTITGDGSTENWSIPSDWDRQVAGDDLWLQTAPFIPLTGPVSDQDWLGFKAAPTRPIRPIWRYYGDYIQIWPVLSATQVCSLEYRTTKWILDTNGTTTKARWEADDDTAKVPERIMTLGIIWRWKRMKGLDYAEEFSTYQLERMKAARSDGGFRTLKAAELFNRDSLTGRKNLYSVVVVP